MSYLNAIKNVYLVALEPGPRRIAASTKNIFSTLACLHIGCPSIPSIPYTLLLSTNLVTRETARVQVKQAETVMFPVGVVAVCHGIKVKRGQKILLICATF